MAMPTTVRIQYPTRRAVLASYRIDGPTLSLFVPTPSEIAVGEEVRVQLSFADATQRFELRGRVTWRRAEARGMRLEPGLGIAFVGGEKFLAAQMLAYCAGKPLELGTSGDPRVPASIPCRVELGSRKLRAKVRDISNSGFFVAAPASSAIQPGKELTVVLEPGIFGWGGKTIRAKVVWTGANKGVHGFGARFLGKPQEFKPAVSKYTRAAG